HTQRALEAMEQHDYPRPPAPRDPNTPQAVYRNPNPGGLVINGRGEIQPRPVPAPSAPAATPAKESPMMPTPKRQARDDGPPGPGQRQIKFLRRDNFTLPDGSMAGFREGDRINLPAAD